MKQQSSDLGTDVAPGGVPLREIVDCTCFRLRRAARRTSQIYDHALAEVGLTVSQFGLLASLYPESMDAQSLGVPLGVLADRVGMDPTTLTRNLKPLDAAALVETRSDPNDRRVRNIRLTPAGADKLAAAAPVWRASRDRIRAVVGTETLAAINSLLDLAGTRLKA